MLDDVIASSPSQTMSSLGIHSVQIPNGPGAPPGGVPGPQVHIIGGNAGPFMQQFQAQNGGISMEQFQEMMNNSNHLDVNQEPVICRPSHDFSLCEAPHEFFSSAFYLHLRHKQTFLFHLQLCKLKKLENLRKHEFNFC